QPDLVHCTGIVAVMDHVGEQLLDHQQQGASGRLRQVGAVGELFQRFIELRQLLEPIEDGDGLVDLAHRSPRRDPFVAVAPSLVPQLAVLPAATAASAASRLSATVTIFRKPETRSTSWTDGFGENSTNLRPNGASFLARIRIERRPKLET